jgi:hypothetical protein
VLLLVRQLNIKAVIANQHTIKPAKTINCLKLSAIPLVGTAPDFDSTTFLQSETRVSIFQTLETQTAILHLDELLVILISLLLEHHHLPRLIPVSTLTDLLHWTVPHPFIYICVVGDGLGNTN